MKDNGFKLTKEKSRRYPAKTITDADNADDIVLLTNTPTQAETLLHSLERAAAGEGLHVNAHVTEYMCFNQKGDTSTLNDTSQKLFDKFTYLVSSVSSNETDINTRPAKAWKAIDWLSVIWKSDLNDRMKRRFFQAVIVLYCCMDALYGRKGNVRRKNYTATAQECCEQYCTSPGDSNHKAAAVRLLTIHHENYVS